MKIIQRSMKNPAGYIVIEISRRVYEHVLVAERALGYPLPDGAIVHHVNEDKADNRPGNLVICQDQRYHSFVHIRTEALKATGNASSRKCTFCKQWGIPNTHDLIVLRRGKRNLQQVYQRSCYRDSQQQYRNARRKPPKPRVPARGSRSGRTCLDESQVLEMRARFAQGETRQSLADAFGVTYSRQSRGRDLAGAFTLAAGQPKRTGQSACTGRVTSRS